MNILIYGGGAVGLGAAVSLVNNGEQVTIIDLPETVHELRSRGIVQTGILGEHTVSPDSFKAFADIENIPLEKYDYILVCIKSFMSSATAGALHTWQDIIGENTPIVLFQNGWGNAEAFIEYFNRDRIFNARVMTGFMKPALHHVDITVHADDVHAGSLFGVSSDILLPLCEALTAGGLSCITTDTIERDLWAKMLYNCALNPLGAMFNVKYERLAASQHSRHIMDSIFDEIFHVIRAAGFSTHWKTADEYREVFYNTLVPATAEHQSSMLQDIRAGRRTEINAMNGAVVALAEENNVEVPVNRTISGMIHFIEG